MALYNSRDFYSEFAEKHYYYLEEDVKKSLARLEEKISFSHGEIYYGDVLKWMEEIFGKSLMPKGESE